MSAGASPLRPRQAGYTLTSGAPAQNRVRWAGWPACTSASEGSGRSVEREAI